MREAAAVLLGAGALAIFAGAVLSRYALFRAARETGVLRDLFSFSIARRSLAVSRALERSMQTERTTRVGRLADRMMRWGAGLAILGGLSFGALALFSYPQP